MSVDSGGAKSTSSNEAGSKTAAAAMKKRFTDELRR
jgi:hypothetical protein